MREILRKKAGKVCRSFEPTAGKHFIFYYPRICVFKAYLRPLPRNEPIVRFLRQAPRRKLWKTKRRKLLAAAAELAFSWGNFIENATRNEAFASCRALLCARWPFFPPQSLRVLLFFRESVFARSCKDQDLNSALITNTALTFSTRKQKLTFLMNLVLVSTNLKNILIVRILNLFVKIKGKTCNTFLFRTCKKLLRNIFSLFG